MRSLIDEALTAAGPLDGVAVDKEIVLGGFAGLLIGSVSQQCVGHGHWPVVVVPPPRDG